VVRNAFVRAGHDAISCDLEPSETERPDGWDGHYQGDVLELLRDPAYEFDLMIAHPPCTYLANSGERWLKGNPTRQQARYLAVHFVLDLWAARIPRVAIENPIGHLSSAWRKPDQIIQPWQFGEPEWKSTCLWLRGLPPLQPTNVVVPDQTRGGGKKPGRISSRLHRLAPGPNRQRERSRTFQGIADAMAEQWGACA
jgi:hypothetical protein